MTKRTKYRMWGVFTPRSWLCQSSVRQTRATAVAAFTDKFYWPGWRKMGYRVAHVVVSEE